MAQLIVTQRDGDEVIIESSGDRSVMELIRDQGIGELLAMCGGCCSCATCHVYVDPSFLDRIAPISEQEHDLLDGSSSRSSNSRLSCQIPFDETLDGLRVTVAPEE
ncbi:UNVERIFIED_CONTAM: 2Fe-2S iron-sulfur cluster-binding protein [Pseudomonas sp. JL1]